MKSKNIFKILGSIILLGFSIFIYNGMFGNPISYIKSKSEIKTYIDENYKDILTIEDISYNLKNNSYIANVVDKNYGLQDSTIEYYMTTGYIGDYYHFNTKMNMEDEVKSFIENLIIQNTKLKRNNLSIDLNIDIEKFKYRIYDKYTLKEPIDISICLQPNYDINTGKKYDDSNVLYKTKEEFCKDTYDIVQILKNTKYKFSNVEIYSYLEDGNSNYRIILDKNMNINSLNDVENNTIIDKGDKIKEESIN